MGCTNFSHVADVGRTVSRRRPLPRRLFTISAWMADLSGGEPEWGHPGVSLLAPSRSAPRAVGESHLPPGFVDGERRAGQIVPRAKDATRRQPVDAAPIHRGRSG